jgi:hypothetical protein
MRFKSLERGSRGFFERLGSNLPLVAHGCLRGLKSVFLFCAISINDCGKNGGFAKPSVLSVVGNLSLCLAIVHERNFCESVLGIFTFGFAGKKSEPSGESVLGISTFGNLGAHQSKRLGSHFLRRANQRLVQVTARDGLLLMSDQPCDGTVSKS